MLFLPEMIAMMVYYTFFMVGMELLLINIYQ